MNWGFRLILFLALLISIAAIANAAENQAPASNEFLSFLQSLFNSLFGISESPLSEGIPLPNISNTSISNNSPIYIPLPNINNTSPVYTSPISNTSPINYSLNYSIVYPSNYSINFSGGFESISANLTYPENATNNSYIIIINATPTNYSSNVTDNLTLNTSTPCTDSDGGINDFVKGVCIDNEGEHYDGCDASYSFLAGDWYCTIYGNCAYVANNCQYFYGADYGCYDGWCQQLTIPINQTQPIINATGNITINQTNTTIGIPANITNSTNSDNQTNASPTNYSPSSCRTLGTIMFKSNDGTGVIGCDILINGTFSLQGSYCRSQVTNKTEYLKPDAYRRPNRYYATLTGLDTAEEVKVFIESASGEIVECLPSLNMFSAKTPVNETNFTHEINESYNISKNISFPENKTNELPSVVHNSTILNGKWEQLPGGIRAASFGQGSHALLFFNSLPYTDFNWTVKIDGDGEVGICGRLDTDGNGFCVSRGWGGTNSTMISKYTGFPFNPSHIKSGPSVNKGKAFYIQLRMDGNTIYGKIWGEDQPEPVNYTISSISESYLKQGYLGFYSYRSRAFFNPLNISFESYPNETNQSNT